MTPEEIESRAAELVASICAEIPISELVECARGNLKATRLTRLSKDHPDGKEEPDFTTRQKALEWIGGVMGVTPVASRKPREPIKKESAGEAGALRPKDKAGS